MQTTTKRVLSYSIILAMMLSLFACGPQLTPTITPTITPDGAATLAAATAQANGEATRIAAAVAQALTAAAPTVTQTPTQTPPSTLTSTPTDTATPAPTDTSVPTDTPRPRPINTATRTPVPPVPKNVLVIFDNKWEITVMGFRHADSLYWGSDRYQAFGTFVSFIVRIKNLQPGTDYYANRFTWWVDDGSGTPKRYGTSVLPEEAAQYNYCGCGNSFDVLQPGTDTVGTVTFDVTKGTREARLIVAIRSGASATTDLRLSPSFGPISQ